MLDSGLDASALGHAGLAFTTQPCSRTLSAASLENMRKRKPTSAEAASGANEESGRPEVMVDIVFDHGLFHVIVANLGPAPAYRVSVKFDRKFHGLGGRQEFSSLRLFRCLEFLAPHKRIETFLDTSSAYFQRREPTRIAALISFRDAQRRAYERRIVHDLSIYKNVSYLLKPAGMTSPVIPGPDSVTATSTTGGPKYVRIERSTLP